LLIIQQKRKFLIAEHCVLYTNETFVSCCAQFQNFAIIFYNILISSNIEPLSLIQVTVAKATPRDIWRLSNSNEHMI